jgi:EAL domain-containing protein (putative c-di-GMP-specific phosphodiesterase class I)
VSANISASNLVREQFPEAVARLLKQSQVNPRHLQLEITETYLHRDEDKAMQSLKAIQAQGVKLWLDDFCTGYSSLKHLHMFPTNGIKIDRQFVINLNKRNEDRLLVSSMISLADSFNIGVVAEGIDNQADRELLLSLGCPLGQGDLFSKPVSAKLFQQLVSTKTRLPQTDSDAE